MFRKPKQFVQLARSVLPVVAQYISLCLGALFAAIDFSSFWDDFEWRFIWLAFFSVFAILVFVRDVSRFFGSKPNIVVRRCFVDTRPFDDMKTGQNLAMVEFAHVEFANEPSLQDVEANAADVVPHVRFFHADGKTKATGDGLEVVFSRWAHVPHASLKGKYGQIDDLIPTDLAVNGQPRVLSLAFRYVGDGDCYAFDNNVYKGSDMRSDGRYQLSGERFVVEVNLRGQRVNKSWRFDLRNRGKGEELSIGPI